MGGLANRQGCWRQGRGGACKYDPLGNRDVWKKRVYPWGRLYRGDGTGLIKNQISSRHCEKIIKEKDYEKKRIGDDGGCACGKEDWPDAAAIQQKNSRILLRRLRVRQGRRAATEKKQQQKREILRGIRRNSPLPGGGSQQRAELTQEALSLYEAENPGVTF